MLDPVTHESKDGRIKPAEACFPCARTYVTKPKEQSKENPASHKPKEQATDAVLQRGPRLNWALPSRSRNHDVADLDPLEAQNRSPFVQQAQSNLVSLAYYDQRRDLR